MHGAGGGAPRGNQNALKHGLYSAEFIEARRLVSELTKRLLGCARIKKAIPGAIGEDRIAIDGAETVGPRGVAPSAPYVRGFGYIG
jgi:hypothetical protein